MEEILTPSGHATPLEKARNQLAMASFLVSAIGILLTAYLGMQRGANETALTKAQKEASKWEQASVRLGSSDAEYLEELLRELVRSLCVSEAEQAAYDKELPAFGSASKWPLILGKKATADKAVKENLWKVPWHCSDGYSLFQPAEIIQIDRPISAKAWEAAESAEERVQLGLQAMPQSELRLLEKHISVHKLAEVFADRSRWAPRREWILDGRISVNARAYDKLSVRYSEKTRFSEIEDLFRFPKVALRFSAAKDTNELRPVLNETVAKAYATVDRLAARMDPASDVASIGGFQMPVGFLIRLLVLPAAFLYALYWVYAMQVEEEECTTSSIRNKTFWFPRLSAPQDPLSVPMPGSVRQLVSRFSWFSFHCATVLFLLLATRFRMGAEGFGSWIPFDNGFERWLSAAGLVLAFWVSRCATTATELRLSATTTWFRWLTVGTVVAAIVLALLVYEIEFDRPNLFFNLSVSFALTALLWWRYQSTSNHAVLVWLVCLVVIWFPYVRAIAAHVVGNP